MILIPRGDNIIVQIAKDENEGKTESGIILVQENKQQDKPDKGVVIAIGSGRVLNNGEILKPTVKEGDKVIFNKFSGTDIEVGEENYLIIKEADVLATITT